ncbi:MAG: BspA family leucine-rich repeat surface protein, partial [Flammeovirgaceae bacterium]|nr:BspA family leucine-rich repeat surface protein [Flammeovirgaceae bacterium]
MKKLTHTILLVLLSASFSWSQAFITTWKTDNPGTSGSNQITIPTTGTGYNYSVNWGDGNNDMNVMGDITHTYSTPGTYTVSITGSFPRIYFNNTGDKQKILTLEAWGTNAWTSMEFAFFGCTNLTYNATDAPNLSAATNMYYAFAEATLFNGNLNNWDVSTITNMSGLFSSATNFNGNIENWNVGNVTNMASMFGDAQIFNQDIGSWNVSNVTDMNGMFFKAYLFNKNLNSWNVSNVTNMASMFGFAHAFNGNISNWDVSKVTNFGAMFARAYVFNQNIGGWITDSAILTNGMFSQASVFNQNIGSWNMSNVTDMNNMFFMATLFNQDIGNWDVHNVTNMSSMFRSSGFNKPIGSWNMENVVNINHMFSSNTSFNQNLSGWNVSNVQNADAVFWFSSSFNQDISSWNITKVITMINFLSESGLSSLNYDLLLSAWSGLTLKPNVTFGAAGISYCAGAAARVILTSAPNNWAITDGGESCIVNIPDANFKAALLAHTPVIDTNDDDEIQVAEAAALTGHLNVANKGINDLTGVESFVNITQLTALGNNLTSVDVSTLTGLTNLGLSNNNITSIDISNNTALLLLYLENNDLTTLDLNSNVQLLNLQINGNQLTSLDLSNNPLLQQVTAYNNDITTVNLTGLTKVTDLNLTNNPITSIDLSDMIKLDNLTLVGNELSTIDLTNNGTIRVLNVQGNNLTSLDISPLTNINWLYAQNNIINSITMSNSTAMTILFLGNNALTSIDLSANTGLTDVRLMDNDLISLNLSANTSLEKLFVNGNALQTLNVKNGNNAAITTFDARTNPSLTCITVDNVSFSQTNWTQVDGIAKFSTNCSNVANDILTFSFAEQASPAMIDANDHDIAIEVSLGTDLTALVPTFTVSSGATANPPSGVVQNFTNEFTYVIAAENPNSTQNWRVLVSEVNVAPTDISLSNSSIDETNSINAVVGMLSAVDPNVTDNHFFSLVAGTGDADNASFEIDSENLIAKVSFDFETKTSYSIRVKAEDTRGGAFEKVLTITINDLSNAVQTIAFTQPGNVTFGDADFQLLATASSALPVSLVSSDPSILSITGTTATILSAGSVSITASQSGNLDYG